MTTPETPTFSPGDHVTYQPRGLDQRIDATVDGLGPVFVERDRLRRKVRIYVGAGLPLANVDYGELTPGWQSEREPESVTPWMQNPTLRDELAETLRDQARWVKSMPPRAAEAMESAASELSHRSHRIAQLESASTTLATELERMRRLHEEATANAAKYRTALAHLVEAAHQEVGWSTVLGASIDAAREALA